MNPWDLLIERLGAHPSPTSGEALRDFERAAGFVLHASVRDAWTRADGFAVSRGFRVLSLAEAGEYIGALEGMQMFAFTGDDSDPFCVCCHPELDGRVARLHHDGGECRLAYRTLDGFARAIVSALDEGDVNPDVLELEYEPKGARTDDDAASGAVLLREARGLCDEGSDCGPRFVRIACSLLSSPEDLGPVLVARRERAGVCRGPLA